MKKILSLLSVAALLFCAACTKYEPRKISEPSVAATNNDIVYVQSVELTDTAIILDLKMYTDEDFYFAESTHLVADGKTYKRIDDDALNKVMNLLLPTGEYKLIFEPLPLNTQSFDFSEGTPEGWDLYGINVSGKNTVKSPLAVIPQELIYPDSSNVFCAPIMEAAPTEIRFHLADYRPEYGDLTVTIEGSVISENKTVPVDNDGNAVLTVNLYGTSYVNVALPNVSVYKEHFRVAPGEVTDVYFTNDLFTSKYKEVNDFFYTPDNNVLFTTGKYSELNNIMQGLGKMSFEAEFDDFYDWSITAEEFMKSVNAAHDHVTDVIDNSYLNDNVKNYLKTKNNIEAATYIANMWSILASLYVEDKGTTEGVYEANIARPRLGDMLVGEAYFDQIEPEYAADPNLLLLTANRFDSWDEIINDDLYNEMKEYCRAMNKAAAAKLTDYDISKLEVLSSPFYAQAAALKQKDTEKVLENMMDMVCELPDAEDDDLFDAIMSAYKGKVVLVDLWNTWCGPCRRALVANEPLKSGELSSDDIAWVYIADESSSPTEYANLLPTIKGDHYFVNSDQIQAIRRRFNVDGIPYYILVDREGNAEGHPDFRDHTELIKGVKSKL